MGWGGGGGQGKILNLFAFVGIFCVRALSSFFSSKPKVRCTVPEREGSFPKGVLSGANSYCLHVHGVFRMRAEPSQHLNNQKSSQEQPSRFTKTKTGWGGLRGAGEGETKVSLKELPAGLGCELGSVCWDSSCPTVPTDRGAGWLAALVRVTVLAPWAPSCFTQDSSLRHRWPHFAPLSPSSLMKREALSRQLNKQMKEGGTFSSKLNGLS